MRPLKVTPVTPTTVQKIEPETLLHADQRKAQAREKMIATQPKETVPLDKELVKRRERLAAYHKEEPLTRPEEAAQ